MIELLNRGGTLAHVAFLLVVLGLPLLMAAGVAWFRRQNLEKAVLDAASAARSSGQSPWRQYEMGRDAALRAAQPSSAGLLSVLMLSLAAVILLLGLMSLLRCPPPLLVADILRGKLQLAQGQSAAAFADNIIQTLIAGSVAAMMAVPALTVAALGFGFLRTWLLGSALDRTLVRLVTTIDPQGESPDLRAVAGGLKTEARRRWSVTAFLLGPFWYLSRGLGRPSLVAFIVWLVLLTVGFTVWYLPGKLIWGGSPLNAGTPAGALWFYLRETIVTLFVLPMWLFVGIRKDG